MSKVVGYFQDNDEEMYSEGPYVLCAHPMGGDAYRIETRGPNSPMMPPLEIYEVRKARGIPEGWQPRAVLEPLVDELNRTAREAEGK